MVLNVLIQELPSSEEKYYASRQDLHEGWDKGSARACGGVLESSSTRAEGKYHVRFRYTIVLVLLSLFPAFRGFRATEPEFPFLFSVYGNSAFAEVRENLRLA